MSSRAMRRLREEKEAEEARAAEEESSNGEEEEEDEGGGGGAFMMMLDEESSEEEESESEDDGDSGDEGDKAEAAPAAPTRPKAPSKPANRPGVKQKKPEEDIDAILSDMMIGSGHDEENEEEEDVPPAGPPTLRSLLLSRKHGFDVQDLDLDNAMRNLLGGAGGGNPHAGDDFMGGMEQPQQRGGRGGRGRGARGRRTLARKYLFGKPRQEWGKPPSYVGGGLGTKELTEAALEEERRFWSVPWPYNLENDDGDKEKDGDKEGGADDEDKPPVSSPPSRQRWHTLQMSDTYQEHNYLYQEMLSSSSQRGGGGALHDPNSLAMFVADHPYFAETILQLAMVLYYVNDRGKGNDLLRRCLFLYETALPSNILPGNDDGGKGSNKNGNGEGKGDAAAEVLMDVDRPPNSGLFAALFRVMQTSGMSGCHDCALASGRFLLSLDPLRDPMGVLLILDYYALASRRTLTSLEGYGGEEVEAGAAFVVKLAESGLAEVHYKDPLTDRHRRCSLLDMPNWAYSYALALRRLSLNVEEGEELGKKSDAALEDALERFPMVLPKLLALNKVNTQDRSFRMDWPTVLPLFGGDDVEADSGNDTVEGRVTRASGEHLVRIFVQRCHKLWKEDATVAWLYERSAEVLRRRRESRGRAPSAEDEKKGEGDEKEAEDGDVPPLTSAFSPALARYAQCDPSEYEDAFRTFPPEAIALDPNIVAPAMALGPDGRRGGRAFRQRWRQQLQRDGGGIDPRGEGQDPVEMLRQLLGMGRAGEMEVLDPDSPLLQLYLQSLLPWAQVEGVRRGA